MMETNMARKKNGARKKKAIRLTAKLTTLDDFLGEEGKRDEFEAIAVKEVLAWQCRFPQTLGYSGNERYLIAHFSPFPPCSNASRTSPKCEKRSAAPLSAAQLKVRCRKAVWQPHGYALRGRVRLRRTGCPEPSRMSGGQYHCPPLNPRRDHGFVPLICPTCQMSSASLEASLPTT